MLRRVGGLIGAKSMVNDALGELFPVIDVERVPGELLALQGTRLGFGTSTVQAGAGNMPQCQLFNPADSGTLVTLTRMIVSTTTGQPINWNTSAAALATLLSRGSIRDTRLLDPAANATVAELRVLGSPVPIGAAGSTLILADTPFILDDDNSLAVLSPGFGFSVEGDTDATLLTVTFYWRERTAEGSELNL